MNHEFWSASPLTQNSNSQHPIPRINMASDFMQELSYKKSEIFESNIDIGKVFYFF